MKLLVILALVGVSFAAALPTDAAPEPVSDTEEVAKAKAEFKALYDSAAAAAAADAVPEVVVPEGAPAPVADTEEVAAAKANFQAAFDAAAARAEAAPDTDLDGALSTYSGYLSGLDGRLSPFYTNTLPYGAFGLHAPVVAGAPFVAGAPYTVGVGAPLLKNAVVGGSHVVGSPLAYNALGLGVHGYGFGLQAPFVRVVA
ncbi:larval cuticle protein F1-like [Macrobrachium nipponense]|uniref:larval cuticle protein F1-like n=1 Tax=Macrobrachium nipponense TaxID=159736 RepID=UPI0030C88F8D